MSRFHDFDAQFAEMRHETVEFRLFGKMYTIEKRMPAFVPLEMARMEDDDKLDNRMVFRAAVSIFGEKNLREWEKDPRFTVEVLGSMVKWAFEAINGKVEPESVTEDDTGAVHSKN